MTTRDYIQLILFMVALVALTKPLGIYMEKVFAGKPTFLTPLLGWLERLFYRLGGIDAQEDQKWTRYAIDMLVFSCTSAIFTYLVLRLQAFLPLNPQNIAAGSEHLSFNTSMSCNYSAS